MNNSVKITTDNKSDKIDIKKLYGSECISSVNEFI